VHSGHNEGGKADLRAIARGACGTLVFQHPTCACSYEVDIYEGRQWIGGKVASFKDKDGNHIEVGRRREEPSQTSPPAFHAETHSLAHSLSLTHSLILSLSLTHSLTHPQMGLHVFFGCYFNLFRLMAKCGVLENLLLKDHTHTFCNLDGDVRELDFRFFLNGMKIGAPFHGGCAPESSGERGVLRCGVWLR
jgi:zeta-carotene desaturase